MEGFISSFKPIFSRYKTEGIFLTAALMVTLISGGMLVGSSTSPHAEDISFSTQETTKGAATTVKLVVDVEGAVKKPGVYEFDQGARLADVIERAQGFTLEADVEYFDKTFNRAKLLEDQEKIYVPTKLQIAQGSVAAASTQSFTGTSSSLEGINLNTATQAQLESLPGIGPVTAEKIMNDRPYSSIQELLDRSVVSQSVFEKISDQVSAP